MEVASQELAWKFCLPYGTRWFLSQFSSTFYHPHCSALNATTKCSKFLILPIKSRFSCPSQPPQNFASFCKNFHFLLMVDDWNWIYSFYFNWFCDFNARIFWCIQVHIPLRIKKWEGEKKWIFAVEHAIEHNYTWISMTEVPFVPSIDSNNFLDLLVMIVAIIKNFVKHFRSEK